MTTTSENKQLVVTVEEMERIHEILEEAREAIDFCQDAMKNKSLRQEGKQDAEIGGLFHDGDDNEEPRNVVYIKPNLFVAIDRKQNQPISMKEIADMLSDYSEELILACYQNRHHLRSKIVRNHLDRLLTFVMILHRIMQDGAGQFHVVDQPSPVPAPGDPEMP